MIPYDFSVHTTETHSDRHILAATVTGSAKEISSSPGHWKSVLRSPTPTTPPDPAIPEATPNPRLLNYVSQYILFLA